MHIGSEHNSLQMTRVATTPESCTFVVEVKLVGSGWLAWVFAHYVEIDPEAVRQGLMDFSRSRSPRLDLAFSNAGWLRVRRHVNGQMVVRYRLGRLHLGAAIEGEIVLSDRQTGEFTRELKKLFQPARSERTVERLRGRGKRR